MLAPPSLQREYTLCYSQDPALDLPVIPGIDRATAPPEDIAHVDKLIAERNQRLKLAHERGEWPVKQGQKLTVFRFRQVGGSAVRWWAGESERRRLSTFEDVELMFRLALIEVEGMAGFTLRIDESDRFPLVSVASMDELYASALGGEGVAELGALVMDRVMGGVRPL